MKIPAITIPGILIILTAYCCGGKERHISSGIPHEGALITKAERFTLEKNDSCTIITIIGPWQGADGMRQVYYLVKKGKKLSIADDRGSVIYIPLESIICMSSTHLAMIAALGEEDAIAGVSGAGFIYNNILSGFPVVSLQTLLRM